MSKGRDPIRQSPHTRHSSFSQGWIEGARSSMGKSCSSCSLRCMARQRGNRALLGHKEPVPWLRWLFQQSKTAEERSCWPSLVIQMVLDIEAATLQWRALPTLGTTSHWSIKRWVLKLVCWATWFPASSMRSLLKNVQPDKNRMRKRSKKFNDQKKKKEKK